MIPCRTQVYKLVQDLHNVGIVHKDIEPRNVVRVHGGGFRLIDFSESRKHICKESKVQYAITSLLVADIGIGRRTAQYFHSSPKSKVFRIADITKLVVETATPSSPWCKFGVRENYMYTLSTRSKRVPTLIVANLCCSLGFLFSLS